MTSDAHIVHHIPGRLRLKIPQAKGNAAFLDQVKTALSPIQGVRGIEVNPTTGSVLVHYDPEDFDDFHQDVHDHASRADLFAVHPPRMTKIDDTLEKMENEAKY